MKVQYLTPTLLFEKKNQCSFGIMTSLNEQTFF